MLEEAIGGQVQDQYVWSPVYVDALVERDDASGQRLYVQQDANWDVTALVDAKPGSQTFGQVVERYLYDPYGRPTDATGAPAGALHPDGSFRGPSAYGWVYLHQGGRYNSASGLLNFRARDYAVALGRGMELDPLSYGAGDRNLYRSVHNHPVTFADRPGPGRGSKAPS